MQFFIDTLVHLNVENIGYCEIQMSQERSHIAGHGQAPQTFFSRLTPGNPDQFFLLSANDDFTRSSLHTACAGK